MRIIFLTLIILTLSFLGTTSLIATPIEPEEPNSVWMEVYDIANGESLEFPVWLKNDTELGQIIVPLLIDPNDDLTLDSVSFVGTRLAGFGATYNWNLAEQKLLIEFTSLGTPIPLGHGLLANIHFSASADSNPATVDIDSTFTSPDKNLTLSDAALVPIAEIGFLPGVINIIPTHPIINLFPEEFFFTTYLDINPPSQFLSITNIGEGVLHWEIIYKPDWIYLFQFNGIAPSDVKLSTFVIGMDVGIYEDSIIVVDDNAPSRFEIAYLTLEIKSDTVPEVCIDLSTGWNLISWNVDTESDDVEDIIADIKDCIDVVLSFENGALTYDPDLPQFSSLKMLDHLHGYWFRMDCDTQLCVSGSLVDPATPIALEENWNLVSYLPTDTREVPTALQSMYLDMIVAIGFDNGALTHDPEFPELSTLTDMSTTFGYWLKTDVATTLLYDAPTASLISDQVSIINRTPAKLASRVQPTPEWINLYGEGLTIDGTLIPVGSQLEMFDQQGNICGEYTVIADGLVEFTPVYRDFSGTAVDEGLEAGELISITVNNQQIKETFTWTSFGGRIELGAMTTLEKNSILPAVYELSQNYPNPFNPETVIKFSLPSQTKVKLDIINILGKTIDTVVDDILPAGRHNVKWNGKLSDGVSAPSGIYFYRLEAGSFSSTKKMILLK